MLGIGISGASAGADAASTATSSRSSKSSSDGTGGFLDALSSSGNGRDAKAASKGSADNSRADSDAAKDDDDTGKDDALQQTSASAGKTGTDQSGTNAATLAAKVGGQSFAQSLAAMPQSAPVLPDGTELAMPQEAPALPDGAELAMPAADASATGNAKIDISKQLAQLIAGDPSGQTVTDAKGGVAPAKGDKTATSTDDDADDSNAASSNAASGTISDALSLLGAGLATVTVPAATSASVLAAAGQLHSGNGKVIPTTDESLGAVTADATDGDTDAVAKGMALLTSGKAGTAQADAGTAADDDGTAADFSVTVAKTKGQALGVADGKSGGDAAQLDIKTAAGDSAGTVTVLEQRRFVGLADGSNSSLVANAMTGNKEWSAAMQPTSALTGASVVTSPSKVLNTLKIQMTPENLGTVTATMRLSGDQLSVDVKVQTAEAYRQLSNDQSAMVDSLRQQGYSVDRVTVTYTAPDSSSNGQTGSQGQQQQQQSGASQGQGSEAQARKQNSGRQAGDQDGVWGTENVGTDDGTAGAAQRVRTGSVYL
jgi:chemotaxis protein MotD